MKTSFLFLFGFALLFLPLMAEETALRPGDTVSIEIAGVPVRESEQINRIYTLDGRGNLSIYPLDIPISAQNFTPSELARRLENAYKTGEIFTHPIVSVKIDTGAGGPSRTVMVGGAVNKPGLVEFRGGLTLFSAISQAGSWGTFADKKRVRIQRLLANGKRTETVYDMRSVTTENDPLLAPDDTIIVPE